MNLDSGGVKVVIGKIDLKSRGSQNENPSCQKSIWALLESVIKRGWDWIKNV